MLIFKPNFRVCLSTIAAFHFHRQAIEMPTERQFLLGALHDMLKPFKVLPKTGFWSDLQQLSTARIRNGMYRSVSRLYHMRGDDGFTQFQFWGQSSTTTHQKQLFVIDLPSQSLHQGGNVFRPDSAD